MQKIAARADNINLLTGANSTEKDTQEQLFVVLFQVRIFIVDANLEKFAYVK